MRRAPLLFPSRDRGAGVLTSARRLGARYLPLRRGRMPHAHRWAAGVQHVPRGAPRNVPVPRIVSPLEA